MGGGAAGTVRKGKGVYIPAHFHEQEISALHDMMRRNSFAALVTVADGVPFATHLPVLLNSETPPYGILRGHVARANPQWRHFEAGMEALMIFSGAHGYISPGWYETQPAVPTWNYTAVHAYGVPRLLTEEELKTLVLTMTAYFEAGGPESRSPEFSDGYIEKLLPAIVGFEMPISRLEGKAKLSQNRSETDRRQVIAALEQSGSPAEAALAAEMQQRERFRENGR